MRQSVIVVGCVAVTAVIVLATNWYRFGSPFTSGYGQWEAEKHFLSGNVARGLMGFMVDPRKSVFLYFPPLLFALFAFRSFLRRYAYDGTFIVFVAVGYLLLNSQFINWGGDWCFGPRYLLFMLPILSLPMLKFFDRSDHETFAAGNVARICVLLGCYWLFLMQIHVHRIEFFAPFRAHAELSGFDDQKVKAYFKKPHWIISRDLYAFAHGRGQFEPLEQIRDLIISHAVYERLAATLRGFAQGNTHVLDDPLSPL